MEWLAKNIPLVAGIGVALLSFLTSLIKFLNQQNGGAKITKRLKEYTEVYSVLPNDIDAKHDIAQLMKLETKRLLERANRKLNGANLTAVIFVALFGGGLSYLFALWAVSSANVFWTVVAWFLFAIAVLFTLGVSIVGLTSMYEAPKVKQSKVKQP